MVQLRSACTVVLLAVFAGASYQVAAQQTPAPLQMPHPHYVAVVLTQDVKASADATWAKIGGFCGIGDWGFAGCTLVQGDGGIATERSVVNEIKVGATAHSYTYTQPVRATTPYNLYHGTLEVQPVTAATSRIVYSFFYDNSMLADDKAREEEQVNRRSRFTPMLHNMAMLAEGGTVPASALGTAPAAPTPEQLQSPKPHYVRIPMTLDVNAPVDKVWARIGNFCDIGEWGIPGCTIVSGDGGLGTIRTIGSEVLVGKTKYSYTYTQPVREGVPYNLYHGTLEAVPLTATTTRLNYTLMFDNSMLADDAAREKDITNRRTRFSKMLDNMKVLAEGGTLPPGAVASPARPAATAPVPPR